MKLFDAHRLAYVLGTPLTTHLTLHWVHTPYRDDRSAHAELTKVMKRLRDWCDHRNIPFRFVWVFENLETSAKRLHTHILLHIPASFSAEFAAHADANGFLPAAYSPAACKVSRASKANAKEHATSSGLIRYILKGIDPNTNEALMDFMDFLKAREDGQGKVFGRRYGVCRHLNRAAQDATPDFHPLLTDFTAKIAAKGV
ncbi:MAG TPA: hypothetical protein VKQ29_04755 [Aliidongia sp.]|nr:hypothetical protein [Aliidongia sp.]